MGIIGITDWVSRGSAEDGTCKLDLAPVEYFIGARKRASGFNYGPLFKGDWYDHHYAKKTWSLGYANDDMQRAPDFASTLTDDEGKYTLYLPKGGRYWLAGRFYAMKMPQPDDPFARCEGSSDHSILVEEGKFLEGIDLVLRPYDGDPSGGAMPMH